MSKYFALGLFFILTACNRTTYYVARHAEKEATTTMATDVPLSAAGRERAVALKEKLAAKPFNGIYSTNTIRTRYTAQPLAETKGLPVQIYDPKDTSFITGLKIQAKGNFLIVGHSNTVDDIVNAFLSKKQLTDLPDTQYGDLFVITKTGKRFTFLKDHFGK